MIYIHISTEDGLSEIEDYTEGCWVRVVNPTEKEIATLIDRFGMPLDFITDPLDIDERARVEVEEGNTLILLRSPKREPEGSAIPFITLPIGIILTPDLIITVSLTEVDVIQEFLNNWVRNFDTRIRTRFVLQLCYRSALRFLRYLKEINRLTNKMENELHRSTKNEQLINLFSLQKSLVYFTTSLRTNSLMFEKFPYVAALAISAEYEEDLYEEAVIENKQGLEMANIYTSILTGMMDAFASVINNNVNVVMKLLTSVTILLMIPTFIVSMYGMNVNLPLQQDPNAFIVVMLFALFLIMLGFLVLIRKKVL